ncbi:MAG: hypothetical protein ACOCWK_07415 [Tangfeifania sp.]
MNKRQNSKDEWLIQGMVDGELSRREEKRFRELIVASPNARKFYGELLHIHATLQSESHLAEPVDFSNQIMEKLFG